MTVTYTHEVANARLCGFSRLLVRWKGSVYKLLYKEFFIYSLLYTSVSILYRFCLSSQQRNYFEKLCIQFEYYINLIPIGFVLGFYVTIVVKRWWSQFESIPWPDKLMMIIGSNVHGQDDRGRLLRRTLIRYLNLTQVLAYRCVSTAVYKRFPTMEHVVRAGIMTKHELEVYEGVKLQNIKYWMPMLWFNNLLSKVRQEQRIYDDMTYNLIIKEANKFRGSCGQLLNYDWISVPLVYTQVVTVAVYMFFISTLLSRQYLDIGKNYHGHGVDLYIPIFTICQFFFYVGWLKVAEQLINPFGEDDDDFEANWCIDRNLEISLLAIDNLYGFHPKLEKDKFWNDSCPALPYTAASVNHKIDPFMGSTFDMSLTKDDHKVTETFFAFCEDTAPENKVFVSSANPIPIEKKDNIVKNYSSTWRLKNQKNVKSLGRMSSTSMSKSSKTSITRLSSSSPSCSDENDESHAESESSFDGEDNLFIFSDLKAKLPGDKEVKINLTIPDSNNNEIIVPKEMKRNKSSNDFISANDSVNQSPQSNAIQCDIKINKDNDDLHLKDMAKNCFPDRPNQLILSNQYESMSAYSTTSSHKLQTSNEESEERKNAEKRVHLYEKIKRNRQGNIPRKRSRKSETFNWLNENLNLNISNFGSSIANSVWSESDFGSGPAYDSPFGSLMSCSTSIPSPKQLRWIKQSRTKNMYGDTTSIASTLTSPSGTDGPENDINTMFTVVPNDLNVACNHLSSINQKDPPKGVVGFLRRYSTSSSGREDTLTPYADDLRKRLQIVPSSSPVPSSPIKHGPFFPTEQKSTWSLNKSKPTETVTISTNEKKKPKIVKNDPSDSSKMLKSNQYSKQRLASSKNDKIVSFSSYNTPTSFVSKSSNRNEPLLNKQAISENLLTEDISARKSNSSLWNALKTWNSKRKETKSTKEKTDLVNRRKIKINEACFDEFSDIKFSADSGKLGSFPDLKPVSSAIPCLNCEKAKNKSMNPIDTFELNEDEKMENGISMKISNASSSTKVKNATLEGLKWETEIKQPKSKIVNKNLSRSYSLPAIYKEISKMDFLSTQTAEEQFRVSPQTKILVSEPTVISLRKEEKETKEFPKSIQTNKNNFYPESNQHSFNLNENQEQKPSSLFNENLFLTQYKETNELASSAVLLPKPDSIKNKLDPVIIDKSIKLDEFAKVLHNEKQNVEEKSAKDNVSCLKNNSELDVAIYPLLVSNKHESEKDSLCETSTSFGLEIIEEIAGDDEKSLLLFPNYSAVNSSMARTSS